ncbi:MAG: DUF354 domain-containing protein [Fervidicoccaceae archaeon]|jgi:predicted glycosyltransferase
MRIWMDALTPKQLLLFSKLSLILERELRAEILLTSRETAEIKKMNYLLGGKAKLIGLHGRTKDEKLRYDIARMAELLDLVKNFSPDMLVSYPSPSAVRIAFGLGIKTIIYSDTPHAFHAHMLTVPLSDYLIFSSFICKEKFLRYIPSSGKTRTVKYRGVDELAWVTDFSPNPKTLSDFGLKPYDYFLVRPPEIFASYYRWSKDSFSELLKNLAEISNVALIPRYEDDIYRYSGKNIIVIDGPVFGLDLEYFSIATVSGGGTMSREASLLGVPSITLFPLKIDVDSGLREMGFPIFRASSPDETLKIIERVIVGEMRRGDFNDLIKKLEHPVEPLKKILRGEI